MVDGAIHRPHSRRVVVVVVDVVIAAASGLDNWDFVDAEAVPEEAHVAASEEVEDEQVIVESSSSTCCLTAAVSMVASSGTFEDDSLAPNLVDSRRRARTDALHRIVAWDAIFISLSSSFGA